ncbi:MAG: threonine--tRNA ligase [Candidatus Pacebacteria bacterium RIFOXYB1_FULL_44_10]|nr:MAG: threonine--tRNA ligase [Candidatus Pacebacteria bacterium RIFOXYB1_FULL_44_10]
MEWIDSIAHRGEKISIYVMGDIEVDLCSGPHLTSTGEVKAFKLLSVAGAYWHGDEKNKMLTRIYGTAFFSQAELDEYLARVEESKRRDHRKLGAELDLFTFSDLVGKGLPIWTPKGATIRRELEKFIVDEELKRGYLHVYTPDIAKLDLYRTSGHYPYYKDTMYAPITIDDEEYMLRPMTCPHHFEFYKSKPHSYKELPMRIAELAKLYRYEKSGELTGLSRVRSFCLADAHIIAIPSQAKAEINRVLDLIDDIAQLWGLKAGENYRYRLSLGDRKDEKKYFKDDASWDYAENVLRGVLLERKAEFYEAENEAAFYGPKIDVQMKNVLGKEDTAFTVQYDFVMPKRFALEYTDSEGKKQEPIVIHRSSIGAIERTMAFLIEHFAGAFPLWLSPVQAVVIPISQDQGEYGESVVTSLREAGLRAELWNEAESMQKRIRSAEEQKIPYMLVVGGREAEAGNVSVRARGQKDQSVMRVGELVEKLVAEVKEKRR